MNKRIYTSLIWVFILFLNLQWLHAQQIEDSDDPDPTAAAEYKPGFDVLKDFQATAPFPKVQSASVIHYSDGISVSVEFAADGVRPYSFVLENAVDSRDTRSVVLSGATTANVQGVTAGKIYNIKTQAIDGQMLIVGTVNTTPFRAGDPVIVSENLYRALSTYVTVGEQATTLSNYLKQLPNVSMHENISFLQRYIMNGAVLPAELRGQYPDLLVKRALQERGGGEGECICNFVMNQVTVIVPDETGINDFVIGAKTYNKFDWYNSSSTWIRASKAQGPARNQLLHNSGLRAGKKKRTETWTLGEEGLSENLARIGYHLMCIGISELPKECECAKPISFDYGYYTTVEARTNTGGFGCVFNQEASARTQDWAVAIVTREKVANVSDVKVLSSGLATATSKCSGGVPVSVLVDVAKIGVSVFSLVKSVKTAQLNDIVNQTNQIIDKVGSVLEQVTATKECDNAFIEKPLVQGSTVEYLHPNDPLSFVIMSGASLGVTGLRCWESTASIKSSFHISAVVSGGSPTATTGHCCTDYFANWAYASQRGDDNSRKNFIAGHLGLNSPGGWQFINNQPNPGGIAQVPTQIGYAIGNALPNGQRCAKQIPLNTNPR